MRTPLIKKFPKPLREIVIHICRTTLNGLVRALKFFLPKEHSFGEYVKLFTGLGGFLGLFVIGYLVITQLSYTTATIEISNLPKTLSEQGYSKTVMADSIIAVAQSHLGIRSGTTRPVLPSVTQIDSDCIQNDRFVQDLTNAFLKEFSVPIKIERKQEASSWIETSANVAIHLLATTALFKGKRVDIMGEVKEVDGDFILEMVAIYPDGNRYRLLRPVIAKKMDVLVQKAGTALLRFSAPWIYAASRIFSDPEDGRDVLALLLAEYPVNDPALVHSLKGFSTMLSEKRSLGIENAKSARDDFALASRLNSKSYWALIGTGVSNMEIHHAKANRTESPVTDDELNYGLDSLGKAVSLRPDYPLAYMVLFNYYDSVSDGAKSTRYKETALDTAREQGLYGAVVTNMVQMLLRRHRGLEPIAKEFQKFLKEGMLGTALTPEIREGILTAAMISAKNEEWDSFKKFSQILSMDGDPCALVRLASSLQLPFEEGRPAKVESIRESSLYFQLAEDNGMRGFHFYNNWGRLLRKTKEYDLAIEKYEKAISYYGDTAWALLNWASVLAERKLFEESEQKYRESLKIAEIPMAIQGFLLSQFYSASQIANASERVNRFSQFLLNVNVYERKMTDDMKQGLWPPINFAAGYAHCSMGHTKEALSFLEKIPPSVEFRDALVELEACIQRSGMDSSRVTRGPANVLKN